MLVDDAGLRLAETNEVDDVAEDLDQARIRRAVEVGEGEVLDAAFDQESTERDEESHEVARVGCEDAVCIVAIGLFCRRAHGGRHDLACCVCEQLRKPFEDFLDLLWVGFAQVFYGEVDTDVTDAAGDFRIFLSGRSVRDRVRSRPIVALRTSFIKASSSSSLLGFCWLDCCEPRGAMLILGL